MRSAMCAPETGSSIPQTKVSGTSVVSSTFVQRSAFELLLRVQRDEAARVVIPRVDGFMQPMHCVVDRCATLGAIDVAMAHGEQRLFRVLEPLRPRIVGEAELREVDPEMRTLFNVNTPEDVERAERFA